MRASKQSTETTIAEHISGAERLVTTELLQSCLSNLLERALNHSLGNPDLINFSINKIDTNKIEKRKSLPIRTVKVEDHREGISLVEKILKHLGINQYIINLAINWIQFGGAPNGGNMRGAILFDIATMQRLEENQYSGIRATNMDMSVEAELQLKKLLYSKNIYNSRIRDALTLATKVCNFSGVIAELCCSDDPDYIGGYVANKNLGYIRINKLKPFGQHTGGRVIFVDSTCCDVNSYKDYLRNSIISITSIHEATKEEVLTFNEMRKILVGKHE